MPGPGTATAVWAFGSAAVTGAAVVYFGATGIDGGACGLFVPGLGELLLALAPLPKLAMSGTLTAGTCNLAPLVPAEPALRGVTTHLQGAAVGALLPSLILPPAPLRLRNVGRAAPPALPLSAAISEAHDALRSWASPDLSDHHRLLGQSSGDRCARASELELLDVFGDLRADPASDVRRVARERDFDEGVHRVSSVYDCLKRSIPPLS